MAFIVLFVIAVVLFVVLLNGIPARSRQARRARTRVERQQLAEAYGWRFSPNDPSLVNRWRGDPFRRPGSRREVHNVVAGAIDGMPFTIFDYQRVAIVQAGVYASYETVTVWAVQVPAVLPHVEAIRKRGARWTIAKELQQVTGHPELDRRYWVIGDSSAATATMLTPSVAALILQNDFESVNVEGQLVTCCQAFGRGGASPDQLQTTLHQLLSLASYLPRAA